MWYKDKELLSTLVTNCSSKTEILISLGFNPKSSGQRKRLNESIKAFGIDDSKFNSRIYDWSDRERLSSIVARNISATDCLIELGLKPKSGNFESFSKYITRYNINIDHFDPIAASAAKLNGTRYQPYDLTEILSGKHPTYSGTLLKNRLIKEDILPNKCQRCGIDSWNGEPITLELDHINGNNQDHTLDNLRILCPNCHSQTATYRSKKRPMAD